MLALGSVSLASTANAVLIDFTGGTVFVSDGTTDVTGVPGIDFFGAKAYEEGGFRIEFITNGPLNAGDFSTIVGDYDNTGNDVIHLHWDSGPFGNVTEVRISKIDGTTFDLGGFRVSTNTSIGGGPATGGEITWVNTSKASNIFTVTPDDWGLGAGPDPLISIAAGNALFDDIEWFSFANDALSSAVGLGLDNFFLDEPGDPDGEDPTPRQVPEPGTLALFSTGLFGLGLARSRCRKS